jgi:phosphoribosylanthranilate isomerase
MKVKICGITRDRELELLDALGVDFVGLWHGVPGGHAELSLPDCARLTAAARCAGRLQPVLVTLLSDVHALEHAVARTRAPYVQLHGYQPPAFVAALRRVIPPTTCVVKALHVRAGRCLEAPLLRSYENAGVDVFLLDAVNAHGRVGSTGQSIDADAVVALAQRLARPFLLAGGISEERRPAHAACVRHPGCLGIDVDTHARGRDGALDRDRIQAIGRAWRAAADEGDAHAEYVSN